MSGSDLALFRTLNGLPDAFSPAARLLSTALDTAPGKIGLLVLLVGMLVRGARSRRAAILALLAFPLANGLTDLFKKLAPSPRPFQILDDVHLLVGRSDSPGTASAHSANMMAVAWVMTAVLGRWGGAWIVLAGLVGLSRVVTGAHFPRQVALGWLCGAVAGTFVVQLAAWTTERLKARAGRTRAASDR